MNPSSRPTRTPLLLTFAALILAAIFAVVAFGQQADAPADADNPIVLRLGRTVERLDDFNARFEIAIRSLAANQGVELNDQIRAQLEPLKPQFLDQRASELVLLTEADRRGVEADPEAVDATLEQLRSNAGSEEAFASLLDQAGFENEAQLRDLIAETQRVDALIEQIQSEIEIGDGELRTFYQGNRDQFTVPAQTCARHILLENVDDAEAVLVDLEGGADFAELASERSIGPSATQGGDLGCFEQERMVAPFAEAAFVAEVGEPVGPVETQFGQHVILVYDRSEAGVQPFDEVRDRIDQQVRQTQVQQRVEALRRGSGVTTYPDRLIVATPDEGSAPADGAGDAASDATDDSDNSVDGDGSGND